jgi:hypothetical protein
MSPPMRSVSREANVAADDRLRLLDRGGSRPRIRMSESGLERPAMDAYRRYAAANGQPPTLGHDDPAALLSATGWRVDRLTWSGAPDANYGRITRPSGTRSPAPPPRERAHPVTARR